jgi:hypothetical protein
MTQPNPAEIAKLLAEFQPTRKSAFEHLYPWQPLIEGLRDKGAAYQTIAAILRQQGLDTNREQIRRFCREQLEEPEKRVQRARRKLRQLEIRQPEDTASSTGSTDTKSPAGHPPVAAENIQQTLDEHRTRFLPGLPRRTGPRIANIKPVDPESK